MTLVKINSCKEFIVSLNRRTAADKILRDKAFDIAKNTRWTCFNGI